MQKSRRNQMMSDSKKTSKKTKGSAIPKKTKVFTKKPVLEEEIPISKPEQINIEQLFKQALLRYNEAKLADNKIKSKEFSHLALICEEYLSSYALIGYSLQDEKVVIFNTPTQKDESALVDLLRATFLEIIQNRP
jgi:hypothetical protein